MLKQYWNDTEFENRKAKRIFNADSKQKLNEIKKKKKTQFSEEGKKKTTTKKRATRNDR